MWICWSGGKYMKRSLPAKSENKGEATV